MANEWYAIASTPAGLTGMSNSNLPLQPFPNTFAEGEIVGISGTSKQIEAGFPSASWTFDTPITAELWKLLRDFVGSNATVEVYIRTRTNVIEADGSLEYANFSCVMNRPTGEVVPPYRFDKFKVEFKRLIPLT